MDNFYPNIALIASEIVPFVKTGGLGDMVGSLGIALQSLGARPFFILPRYRTISTEGHPSGIPTYFIDIPEFFDRPFLYGEGGKDYPDNCARFAAFCRGALELIRARRLPCEILHLHDWQTALIPLYLENLYGDDPFFQNTGTVLTFHNLGYQGIFPREDFEQTGLGGQLFNAGFLEFHGKMNLLKGGIVSADAVTTVSPTYAREVLTPELGFGLEGVLKERRKDFCGILNGIDTEEWNPETDPHLPARYSRDRMEGKLKCKLALQKEMQLPESPDVPVIGMVSRLVDQKGIDLAAAVIPTMIDSDVQWILLGSGDPKIEKEMTGLARAWPKKVAVKIGFEPTLAHRIEGGADFFLMPSRYEPCGYNQMYSQRYGTIPIVRATGGLKDTVHDFIQDPHRGTGIVFDRSNAEELKKAILSALDLYKKPKVLAELRHRAMRQDFSWNRSAAEYVDLYQRLLVS